MRGNYTVNSGVRFRMLTDDQLAELYNGVLHVLEYTGLEVHHENAREILKEAGAWVDGLRVRIPSYLVKISLELALRSFTIFSRDGNPEHDIRIGPGRGHFGPGPTCPNFIDVELMGLSVSALTSCTNPCFILRCIPITAPSLPEL